VTVGPRALGHPALSRFPQISPGETHGCQGARLLQAPDTAGQHRERVGGRNARRSVRRNDTTRTAIKLTTGNFIANDIYEFSYTAKDPKVAGVGFAAVRDFNSFLKYNATDDFGTANPLFGHVKRIYTEISSQPGRLLNDFRHLGFNQDESGRKVLDGLMQWVAGGDGINMNYRWSQTGRTERNRQDHLYLEGLFPFANQTTYDPISGTTDGRLARCGATNTCPLAMEFFSSNSISRTIRRPASTTWRASSMAAPAIPRARATASSSSIRSIRRPCSARSSWRWTSGRPKASRRPPRAFRS
jgi:hypothetical protein